MLLKILLGVIKIIFPFLVLIAIVAGIVGLISGQTFFDVLQSWFHF